MCKPVFQHGLKRCLQDCFLKRTEHSGTTDASWRLLGMNALWGLNQWGFLAVISSYPCPRQGRGTWIFYSCLAHTAKLGSLGSFLWLYLHLLCGLFHSLIFSIYRIKAWAAFPTRVFHFLWWRQLVTQRDLCSNHGAEPGEFVRASTPSPQWLAL